MTANELADKYWEEYWNERELGVNPATAYENYQKKCKASNIAFNLEGYYYVADNDHCSSEETSL